MILASSKNTDPLSASKSADLPSTSKSVDLPSTSKSADLPKKRKIRVNKVSIKPWLLKRLRPFAQYHRLSLGFLKGLDLLHNIITLALIYELKLR